MSVTVGLVNLNQVIFHEHNIRVELGDLRELIDSIRRFGLLQPIVVEKYGTLLRLRAGHRRTTAARIAGLTRVPAIIHQESLGLEEWIIQSVHENTKRRELDKADRKRAVDALRDLHCSWAGIADAFGISEATARNWANEQAEKPRCTTSVTTPKPPGPRARATARLIEAHRAEFEQMLAEEEAKDVDWVVVNRALSGQKVNASKAEKTTITNEWRRLGKSLNELERIQGWRSHRYIEEAA